MRRAEEIFSSNRGPIAPFLSSNPLYDSGGCLKAGIRQRPVILVVLVRLRPPRDLGAASGLPGSGCQGRKRPSHTIAEIRNRIVLFNLKPLSNTTVLTQTCRRRVSNPRQRHLPAAFPVTLLDYPFAPSSRSPLQPCNRLPGRRRPRAAFFPEPSLGRDAGAERKHGPRPHWTGRAAGADQSS